MAERNFNWGDAYMQSLQDPMRATPGLAPEGVMGGIDLVQSGRNVAGGQGEFLDYLTLALAPTAFAGYGVSKLPAAARALDTAGAKAVLNSTLKNPDFAVGLPDNAAQKIAEGEKYKSYFETRRLDDFGSGMRGDIEALLFGIPRNAPASVRPTYGALVNRFNLPRFIVQNFPGITGEALRKTDLANPRVLSYGGDNPVVMSGPTANLDATFSIGDTFRAPTVYPLGDSAARKEAVAEALEMLRRGGDFPYIETQIAATNNPAFAATKLTPAYRLGGVNNTGLVSSRLDEVLASRLNPGNLRVAKPVQEAQYRNALATAVRNFKQKRRVEQLRRRFGEPDGDQIL